VIKVHWGSDPEDSREFIDDPHSWNGMLLSIGMAAREITWPLFVNIKKEERFQRRPNG